MQNNKNLVFFLVLSVLLVVGWAQLQMWLHPRPVPTTQPSPAVTTEERWPFARRPKPEQDAIVARLAIASLAAGSGVGQPSGLATDVAVLSRYLPSPDAAPVVERLPMPHVDEPAVDTATLGNDTDFFLKAELTSRGAAVRRVVLNRFQMADGYGLPAWQNAEKKVPLKEELVPPYRIMQRTELPPSPAPPIEYDLSDPFYHFLLYHYAKPDDDRPLETLGEINWRVLEKKSTGDTQSVAFVAEVPGEVRITKTFTLAKGDYHIGLAVKLESLRPDTKSKFRYQLTGARGLPIEGEWYTFQLRTALIGLTDKEGRHVWREQEDSRQIAQRFGGERVDRGDKRIQYAAVGVQYFASAIVVDNDQKNRDFLEWARPTLEQAALKGQIKTIDGSSFVLAADTEYTFQVGSPVVRLKLGQLHEGSRISVVWKLERNQLVAVNLLSDEVAIPALLDDITVRVMTEPVALEPGTAVEHKYLLYNGPVKVRLLGHLKGDDHVDQALVDRYETTLHLNTLTDYGRYSFWTDIIIWFTNRVHDLLDFLHTWIWPWSYGICIILVTVLVRGMMFPITRRQTRISKEMQEKMAKLSPELKKLKEKYKDDPLAMYREQQDLFRRHNINQFAMMGGCLPLLLQMPIFMGLYYALQESISFRLEPFLYIRNLAAPDMLFWWSEQIPMMSQASAQGGMLYLGPYFNLLPVIAVALMLVQQTLTAPPPTDEQQEMQMKMMKYMMVVMGLMFYKMAAGLCIYFIASSLWGLAERKLLGKKAPTTGEPGSADANVVVVEATPQPESRKPRTETAPRMPSADDGFVQRWRHRFKKWWGEVLKEAGKQKQARREPRDDNNGRKKKRRDDETTRRRNRD